MTIDCTAAVLPPARPASPEPGDLMTDRITDVRAWLSRLEAADLSDRDRIRVVAALEQLAGAVAGAQARMTAAYAHSQRALGCSSHGVAAEVGLARRVGLSRATRLVAAARTLVTDLPETLEHLDAGRLSETRAVQVAGQLADLEPAARQEVDAMVAPDLPQLGDAEVRDAVDAAITRIDPEAIEARRRAACRRRRVTVRPGADGMAWLSVHTTAIEAAAALNTLHAHADSVLAGTDGLGDLPEHPEGRTHPEVMADAALSRLTGRSVHEGPPVEIQLVMTDTALMPPSLATPRTSPTSGREDARSHAGRSVHDVARVVGVGPVPAGVARDLIRSSATRPSTAPATTTAPDGNVGGWTSPASPVDSSTARVERSSHRPGPAVGWAPGPWRIFEGPDWDFDDRTAEQRQRAAEDDRAAGRGNEPKGSRVTLRRVLVTPDGRNPVAVDARRRLVPAAVRAAIPGHGDQVAPGQEARPGPDASGELRRWFARLRAPARPEELATLTSPQRCARGLLRLLVVLRDQRCRVPWCTAPIRHLDHVTPHRDRPMTDATGLAGVCVGHNLAKEDPGQTVTVTHEGTTSQHPHTIAWTTPTGHVHDGVAPPVLGWGTTHTAHRDTSHEERTALTDDALSPLEALLAGRLAA